MHASPWVGVDEVARALKAPLRQVEQWCASGAVPAERHGREWRVSPSWASQLKGEALETAVGRDVARSTDEWT